MSLDSIVCFDIYAFIHKATALFELRVQAIFARMFLSKIDWTNPRFARWNLCNLEPMNEAQLDAFFEDSVSKKKRTN